MNLTAITLNGVPMLMPDYPMQSVNTTGDFETITSALDRLRGVVEIQEKAESEAKPRDIPGMKDGDVIEESEVMLVYQFYSEELGWKKIHTPADGFPNRQAYIRKPQPSPADEGFFICRECSDPSAIDEDGLCDDCESKQILDEAKKMVGEGKEEEEFETIIVNMNTAKRQRFVEWVVKNTKSF